MKYCLCLFIFFIINSNSFGQPVFLNPKVATAKQLEYSRLTKMVDATLKLPFADSTQINYESAFWAMEYLEYKPSAALPKLKKIVQLFSFLDTSFRNNLLELIYSNYPKELEYDVKKLLKEPTLTPKQFAVCSEYLIRANPKNSEIVNKYLSTKMGGMVEAENVNLYYYVLDKLQKNKYNSTSKKEVIKSLLNNEFLANKNVLISFQNKNRNYPGLVLIKQPNGELVKLNDTIFYVPQLARSSSNLPYYISNGNTPQGIFRVNGFGISTNSFIGPTQNLQLCMPYECALQDFFDESIEDTLWNKKIFVSIIPEKFQEESTYGFLLESLIASMVGRFEIISHGTTVNSAYYKSKPYYGFTPTMGCLQTKETWNYQSGLRTYSDQEKLVNAYKSIGAEKGYLIVLDIIDANRAVTLNDIKNMMK
jgi:hypothetical protein